jgi:hypothetical protein
LRPTPDHLSRISLLDAAFRSEYSSLKN